MDADDWLKIIETKLDFTNCNDEEYIALAVHQLEGPAKSWWDSYCDSHADPAHISWEEFARAFRDQHVPKQVLVQKAQEFRKISQGTMKVEEYERHFMKMMRYAPDDTNTEEKKQFWFHCGLHHSPDGGRMRVHYDPPYGEPLHCHREGETWMGRPPAQQEEAG